MVQTCSGICTKLQSKSMPNGLRYQSGHKWCSLCALFFLTQDYACPCCKTRLRSKRRRKTWFKKGCFMDYFFTLQKTL